MTQPAQPPRRNDDGRWLCNAAPDCDGPAVVQRAADDPTGDDPSRTVPVYACQTHA